VFAALPQVKRCMGCFGCWVVTPGACVTRDRARGFAALVSRHDELCVVSRLVFGGFSPAVKAVVDRSLAHILPFFEIKGGVMRHVNRSPRPFRLKAVFYGTAGDPESEALARTIVEANAANLSASGWEAGFVPGDPEAPLL
jgi:hypothetical protein